MKKPDTAPPGPVPEAMVARAAKHDERVVTRHEIRRFAHAIGAKDASHYDVEVARLAGYPDLRAPRSFYIGYGLSLGRDLFRGDLGDDGLPLQDELSGRRVAAGETSVSWFADIYAGDLVSVRQELIGKEAKRGRAGTLEIFTYERVYVRAEEILIAERFARVCLPA